MSRAAAPRTAAPRRRRGFTLIELMIVVALIAIVSAVASLALRDPAAARLEREATRLAALLESARAESRTLGTAVIWLPIPYSIEQRSGDFRFIGLPDSQRPDEHWSEPGVLAEVEGATPAMPGIALGPEPIIAARRIVLRLGEQRITLGTDGLSPFEVQQQEDLSGGSGTGGDDARTPR